MHPVLFTCFGIRLWSYPACLWLGLVLGITAQNGAANAAGLNSARVYLATLLLLPIAITGSRLWHVAVDWGCYRHDPRRIWARAEGGMSMLGAVPCMLLASVPVLALFDVPFWSFWDVSIFCIFVAMVPARFGCLLNGCCCGRPTEGRLGVFLPDEHGHWQRRVPLQVLEAAAALLLLSLALAVWPWLTRPGTLFLLSAAAYGGVRLALQPVRCQQQQVRGWNVQGAVSLALVVWSLATLALL